MIIQLMSPSCQSATLPFPLKALDWDTPSGLIQQIPVEGGRDWSRRVLHYGIVECWVNPRGAGVFFPMIKQYGYQPLL